MALGTKLNATLRRFIEAQPMFFVATAAATGRVNVSPKGADSLRIVDDQRIIWLNLSGSGNETAGHLRALNRMTLMFCAFEGPPKIVRLHGTGSYLTPDDAQWQTELAKYKPLPGARAIIQVDCTRISDSCGFGVPRYETPEDREALLNWADKKGDEGVVAYQQKNNLQSIDGLPALEPIE